MAAYVIRPAEEADLALIHAWRTRPHVAEWWGDPNVEPEAEKLTDPNIDLWLAELDGRPFAFLNCYNVDSTATIFSRTSDSR